MTAVGLLALIAFGGAVGAVIRWGVAASNRGDTWPVATMIVNTVASFLLGAFSDAPQFITVGVLGALSTWSTLALELVELGRRRSTSHAAVAAVSSLVAGVGAAWLGLVVGSAI